MQNNTMAMQITENNYPVALACLAAGFAGVPLDKVLGHYLVMNELGILATELEDHATTKHFALSNSWYGPNEFWATYVATEDTDPAVPFHVRHR